MAESSVLAGICYIRLKENSPMARHPKAHSQFVAAIEKLNLAGPYFVEERIARHRGRFLRAVKDVVPGESWWEVRHFFTHAGPCWAYLPEQRSIPQFAWGHTLEQAYLNAILNHVS